MYDGAYCHDLSTPKAKPKLSFNGERFPKWKTKVKEKPVEILKFGIIAENACPL